jgi:hypothetical protein
MYFYRTHEADARSLSTRHEYLSPMPEADPVMRAARNGFGVLIVTLLALWSYQFAIQGDANQLLFDLLLLGALVYWLSQWYYNRQELETSSSADGDGGEE